MNNFIHLHNHSHYSILDGIVSVDEYIEESIKNNYKAVAITDHGSLASVGDLYFKCKDKNIKPIYGCEFYMVEDLEESIELQEKFKDISNKEEREKIRKLARKTYHIVLLAKNEIGLENLFILNYFANKDGFYYNPRIDFELMNKYSEGLIALSACLAGIVPKHILENKIEKADFYAKKLKHIFKDDFYIELQMNDIEDQIKATPKLIEIAEKNNIKTVITGDIHYLKKEDKKIQDAVLLIGSKKTFEDVENNNAWLFDTEELYFKSKSEIREMALKYYDISEEVLDISFDNTMEIYDKIEDIEIDTSFKFVDVDNPKEKLFEYIKKTFKKYPSRREKYKKQVYRDRLSHEINVIQNKKMLNYFVTVANFVYESKKHMMVGPGRGSGGGCLLNYFLGITDVDPIKFNLSFERFLGIEITEMPDIDVDFENQELVKNIIRETYGEENVLDIANFGHFKIKGLLKDVCRIFNIDYKIANDFNKKFDYELQNCSSDQADDYEWLYNNISIFRKFVDEYGISVYVKELLNKIKYISRHAGGIIIYDDLYKKVPTVKLGSTLQCCYDKDVLKDMGFVKYDCLGLDALSIIHNTVKLANKDLDYIHPDTLDLNDRKVFDHVFNNDNLIGVFQFDTVNAKKILSRIKIVDFEDLVAVNSLNRPALIQAGFTKQFITLKNLGRSGLKIDIPGLQEILKDTYGLIVYQEQVAFILNKIGNIDINTSHQFRKIVSKTDEKSKSKIEEIRKEFFKNLDGKTEDRKIENLWNHLIKFADYSFNRSHAVAYTLLGYQLAYLKTYHPVEFYTSLFRHYDITRYGEILTECKKHNIKVEPPSMKNITVDFVCDKDTIYFGLKYIKGFGEKSTASLDGKKFDSFTDFIVSSGATKTITETLIKIGFFRHCMFGDDRKKYMEYYDFFRKNLKPRELKNMTDTTFEYYDKMAKRSLSGEKYSDMEISEFEKQYLGIGLLNDIFNAGDRNEKINILTKNRKVFPFSQIRSVSKRYIFSPSKIAERNDKNGKTMAFIDGVGFDGVETTLIIFSSMYKYISMETNKVYVIQCYKSDDKLILGSKMERYRKKSDIDRLVIDIDEIVTKARL